MASPEVSPAWRLLRAGGPRAASQQVLTVLGLAAAPTAVRDALAPLPFRAPDPQAGATVRSVWFDEQGAGVERGASARRS